ncbi:hypothetical protein EauM23_00063 [Exiguobacterium phage vB_EauM-23]|nr:hypothetical protein EauM23_00063 [Exiguobacterium phage vB_EauM-23]
MKMAFEIVSFTAVIMLFAFCFVALFAHQWWMVLVGGLGLGLLLLMEYARDRRSARRRREYWNGTGL